MATTSKATAVWHGKLKDGNGHFEAGSGSFKGQYTFPTRFEGKPGTNPEELIAAAHAACLSMALSGALEKAGTPSTSLTTTAHCTIDVTPAGALITTMKLEVSGKVPGIDQPAFAAAVEGAKENCPVSKALKGNVAFELSATLES
jgi:osmotically inducible protein OsmC